MNAPKLTEAQRTLLENAALHPNGLVVIVANTEVVAAAFHEAIDAGWLKRRGLFGEWRITDAGRAALQGES
jgi:hypothetical protein